MDGSVQKQGEMRTKRFTEFAEGLKSVESVIRKYLEQVYASTPLLEDRDVKKFLCWLSLNDRKLTAGLKDDIKKGRFKITVFNFSEEQISFLLGFWLGGRYVVSQCLSSAAPKFPELWLLFGSGYDTERNYLSIEPSFLTEAAGKSVKGSGNCFVAGFNMGIHEHTHALSWIKGSKKFYLPEISAYLNTVRFGLPLKADKALDSYELAGGKRNIQNVMEQLKNQKLKVDASILISEYAEMWIGPWILAYYEKVGKKIDAFDFQVSNKDAKASPALFEITSNPRVFVPKENFFLDDRIKKWPKGYDIDDFCRAAGIKDPELKALLSSAFDKIRGRTFRTQSELVNFFIATMNETFGKPRLELLPEGFVRMENPLEKNAVSLGRLSSVVPKKAMRG